MPTMDQEPCTTSSVYCPWPRLESLSWTRSRRQRDYIYSFCRLERDAEADGSQGMRIETRTKAAHPHRR